MLNQAPVHWYGDEHEHTSAKGWRKSAHALIAWIERLSFAMAALAAVMCILLAGLTTILVIFGAFNLIHNGFEELKWHLCGALFLLSGAFCFERNAHVRVDTFYARFSPKVKAMVDAVGIVLFVWPLAIAICYYGLLLTTDAFVHSEASNDAGGLPWRWVIKSVIPIGFLLLFMQSVAVFLRALLCICADKEAVHD